MAFSPVTTSAGYMTMPVLSEHWSTVSIRITSYNVLQLWALADAKQGAARKGQNSKKQGWGWFRRHSASTRSFPRMGVAQKAQCKHTLLSQKVWLLWFSLTREGNGTVLSLCQKTYWSFQCCLFNLISTSTVTPRRHLIPKGWYCVRQEMLPVSNEPEPPRLGMLETPDQQVAFQVPFEDPGMFSLVVQGSRVSEACPSGKHGKDSEALQGPGL